MKCYIASTSSHSEDFAADLSETAFTVIELLVTIGIIAILAALSTPIISKVKESSAKASCVSSMRQIGVMNSFYAIDNDGWYVPIHQPSGSGGDKDYWYQNPSFRNVVGFEFPSFSGGAHYPKKFICPNAKYALQQSEHDGYARIDHCYGFNETNLLNLRGYQGVPMDAMGPLGARISDLTEPSKVIQMVDAMSHSVDRAAADKYKGEVQHTGAALKATAFRHNGKAVTLFFDGHIEVLGPDVLADKQTNLKLWSIR